MKRERLPTSIVGLKIKLAHPPCSGCGSLTASIHEGNAFHCSNCGKRRGVLSDATASFVSEVSRMFGAPETIAVRLPASDACVSTENAPRRKSP